jgi:hypothetical protein
MTWNVTGSMPSRFAGREAPPRQARRVFVSGATPITFIGDSHTLAYADLVFRDAADELFATRSYYCRGITASGFVDATGNLNADVQQALLAAGFVERVSAGLVARHRASDLHSLQVGIAMQRPRSSPILVFSIGDLDLKFGFIKEFAAGDFELPAAYGFDPAPFPAAATSERVPFALAVSFVRRLLAPYFRGLVMLARLGFEHLYLHALPPQSLDDDAFERINGFRAPARLRYKATRVFNDVLRDFVRDYPEFGLVDTWDRVTTNGVVDAGFHLDDSHLNRRGAVLAVEDVLADLTRRSVPAAAPAATLAAPQPPSATATRFAQDGIFAIDLGADAAGALRAGLAFAPDPDGARVRGDWAGEPLGGSRFVAGVRPDAAFLERCAALLFGGETGVAIADCVGAPFTVASLRVLKALAPADQQLGVPPLFARGETPGGMVRGILYLSGPGPGDEPLVFAARSGAAARLQPPAGTLVLYDPLRFEHRESLAGNETVELIFVAITDGAAPRIVSAGSNHFWPLDPAGFDTAGLTIHEVVR